MNKNLLFVLLSFSLLNSMQQPLPYGYSLRANGKGWRERNSIHWRQEDTVKCVKELNGDLFVSLFDGHGGDAISTFLKNNFYNYLHQARFITGNFNTRQCLESAFQEADQKTPSKMEDGFDMNGTQGSTALVGVLEKSKFDANVYEFTVGWLGDSRAVVENDGKVLLATEDHTPHNEQEMDRLKKIDGSDNAITANKETGIMRVNGVEVSRAFGNKDIRGNFIISEPQIEQITLIPEENKFLIFASDGIWHKISSEEGVKIVDEAMKKTQKELDNEYPEKPTVTWGKLKGEKDVVEEGGDDYLRRVARALCAEAVAKGSEDNISVIIVRLAGAQNAVPKTVVPETQKVEVNRDQANPANKPQTKTWWSSQSPRAQKYIKGLAAALGLTALGTYLYYKLYGKN